jgi:hypothetical protein
MSLEAMRRRTSPIGKLNAGTIVGIEQRKVEGGAAVSKLLGVGDGFSGGVVIVAEVFSAHAGAAAAVAVGEDVAALVLFGGWCGALHGWGPSPVKSVQSIPRKDLPPEFPGAGLV